MPRCRLPRAVAIVLVVPWTVSAQPPIPGTRDPQSTYEPRSAPGAGQKFLARFAGDWDVAKTFYPRSGEPAHQKGVCRQTMIQGNRFLKSEFSFERRRQTSTGLGIIGFDTTTGRFTSVWIDSRRTAMSMRESRDPFNGSEIVLYSAALAKPANVGRGSRTVTRLEDEGRRIVHRQYMAGADGKERLMMELILTRKDSAPDNGKR